MLRRSPLNTSAARIGLRYGLFTGIGMTLYFTLLRFIWPTAPWDIQNLVFLVLGFGIIKGIQKFRQENKGRLTWLQGWGAGSMLSAVAGIIYGLITLLIIFLYEPTGSEIHREAVGTFLFAIFYIVVVGGIFSLIASLFYQKSN